MPKQILTHISIVTIDPLALIVCLRGLGILLPQPFKHESLHLTQLALQPLLQLIVCLLNSLVIIDGSMYKFMEGVKLLHHHLQFILDTFAYISDPVINCHQISLHNLVLLYTGIKAHLTLINQFGQVLDVVSSSLKICELLLPRFHFSPHYRKPLKTLIPPATSVKDKLLNHHSNLILNLNLRQLLRTQPIQLQHVRKREMLFTFLPYRPHADIDSVPEDLITVEHLLVRRYRVYYICIRDSFLVH